MPIKTELDLDGGGIEISEFTAGATDFFDSTPSRAEQNLNVVFNRQPDEEAEILRLSEKTRWPVAVVRARKKEAIQQAEKEDFRAIDEAALLGFIAKSPENAALVKDDTIKLREATGYLAQIQKYGAQLAEDVKQAHKSGDINLQLAPLYDRKFIQQENSPELDAEIKALEDSIPERTDRKDFIGEVATILGEQTPLVISAIESGLSRVEKALPILGATTLIAGLATGGTGAIPFAVGSAKGVFALGVAEKIAGLEGPLAAKEYSEFRDEDGNPLDADVLKYSALTVGFSNAIVEMVTDVATLGLLKRTPGFKKILSLGPREAVAEALKTKTFRTALKRIAIATAGGSLLNGLEEAIQELVTTLGGEAAKDVSPGEFEEVEFNKATRRIFEAGRIGTLGGFGFGVGTGSVSVATAAIQKGILIQQAKAVKERPQSYYDEQVGLAERLDETKTKERSPAKIGELLEDGGLIQNGLVDGVEAQTFYQTEENAEIFTKLGITEEEVNKAALSGQTLSIKLSEIQSILTLEESKKFFGIVRETSDSLSLKEAKDINVQEELVRIEEALETVNKEQTEFLEEKKRVESEIFKASKIRKIFKPSQTRLYAKGLAEILGNFSVRMSIEGDQSPATTLKRITTDLANFKDIADAEKFIGENDFGKAIPLGVTQIAPEGFVMKLFEGANPSTLIHETGHVFFNEALTIINMGKASENLVKDFDVVKEWLKVSQEEGITIKQQDKFAEAFELYLREGKAPTKGLTPFFERFKKWLTTVYAKVKGSPIDVDLNDEIRGVFDRLLAVEQQTEQFVEENEFVVSDKTFDELGVTDEERLDFRRRLAGSTQTANKVTQQKLAKEHKANIQTWTEEAKIEVAGRRVNNLYSELTSSKRGFDLTSASQFLSATELNKVDKQVPDAFNNEGMDPKIIAERFGYESVEKMFKSLIDPLPDKSNEGKYNQAKGLRDFLKNPILGLSKTELEYQIGKQATIRLKAKNTRLVREDGQSPSTISLEYGYESLDEMTEDLGKRIPRTEQVQEIVSQKEQAHYLNFTANDFFLNEKNKGLEKSLDSLGKFLRKKAGIEVDVPAQTLREEVDKKFATLPVKEATRTDWHLSAMRQALRNRDKSIKNGQFKEAVKFHEQARLNYEFARRSNQIRRDQNNLRKLVKKSGQSKGKIEFDYWKNITALGNKFGLRKGKESQNIKPFQNLLDAQASLLDASMKFRPWIENISPQSFRELTVSQFEELKILFEVLDHIGRKLVLDETVLADIKYNDLKQALLATAEKLPARSDFDSESLLGKLDSFGKAWNGDIDTIHHISTNLDGFTELGPKGTTGRWGNLYDEGIKADSEMLKINAEFVTKTKPSFNQLSKSFRKNPGIISSIKTPVPEILKIHNRNWYFETVVSIAMNMGNRQNIEAVKEGYGLTDVNLNEILSVLTKADWLAIQNLGKEVGSFRERLFSIKRKIAGFEPTTVRGDTFITPKIDGEHLTLKDGWYYPLVPDSTLIPGKVESTLGQDFQDSMTAAVPDSFLMDRTNFGGNPVKLDLSVLARHINGVSLYISHAEYIKDMSRLFNDKEVSKIIIKKLGPAAFDSIRASIRNIAHKQHEELMTMDRLFERIRERSTIYILGLNIKTAVKQFFSTPGFWNEYGFGTWVNGVGEILGSNLTFKTGDLIRNIHNLSPFMKSRGDHLDVSIHESIRKSLLEKPIRFTFGVKPSQVAEMMFALIRGADFLTVAPQWLGAFRKGKKLFGGDMNKAVIYADKAVRTTQPSFRPIDLSPLQESRKGLSRAFTMFSTMSLLFGRRQRTYLRAVRQGQITPLQFLRAVVLEGVVPPVLMNFMFAAFRGEFPEPEDLLIDTIAYQVFGIPLAKEFGFIASNLYKGKKFGQDWNSPLFAPFDLAIQMTNFMFRLIKDLDNEKRWKDVVASMAEILSFFWKFPAPKLARKTIKGMEQVERGEGTPLNILFPQPFKKK